MGLVDVGLVGKGVHVVAEDDELAGDVGSVLQVQGAVHLDDELAGVWRFLASENVGFLVV